MMKLKSGHSWQVSVYIWGSGTFTLRWATLYFRTGPRQLRASNELGKATDLQAGWTRRLRL